MANTQQQEVKEATVTPWTVVGKVDYNKLITKFGTSKIDEELIKRWERVTGHKAHTWMKRGIIFSHRDLDHILNCVETGVPIFLYTGRGPSSESMHLGHMVPFKFTKYLQDALNCIVVIQMSDDEKFLFKDGSKPKDLKKFNELTYKNVRDIIACGFDVNKTYIFSNLEKNGGDLYFNNMLIANATTANTIKSIYGIGEVVSEHVVQVVKEKYELELQSENPNMEKIKAFEKLIKDNHEKTESNSIGQCMWPVFQCGPAFVTSFRGIFISAIKNALKEKGSSLPEHIVVNFKKALKELYSFDLVQSICCLVPLAVDQDPYFRMSRDVAHVLNCPKPSVIISEFLPGLGGPDNEKMSSSENQNSTLFLDMPEDAVVRVIKKYAFSGGGATLDEHQKGGGNIRVDVCYQYLVYFLEDEELLEKIARDYSNGDLTTGELKDFTGKIVANVISEHQKSKAELTEERVMEFFDANRVLDIGGCYMRFPGDLENVDYSKTGINFDRTFGYVPKCERV